MQVRVSPEVNALLDDATALSARRGQPFVGVENLLEAVLQKTDLLPKSVTPLHLKNLHVAARELANDPWRGAVPFTGQEVFYTPRVAQIINETARLADRLGARPAGAGHLLLAMLSDPHAAPSRVMDRSDLQRDQFIESLRKDLYRHARDSGREKARQAAAPDGQTAKSPQDNKASAPVKGLESLTRNLTELARQGDIEPAVGRSRETCQILEILARKSKNNVILVGDAGTGKTRVVEGLAVMLASGRTEAILGDYRILELSVGVLMAGTQYRGSFEEKLTTLLDEIKRSGDIILFIDEIHLIMGAGATGEGSMDLANLLKPALARGELRCIGATTLQEYRRFIEKDPAVERRFQMVRIEELSPSATLEVLAKLRPSLEKHHRVKIGRRSLEAAVRLTHRYMPNRRLPDKAIDMLDQACARYRLKYVAATEKEKSGRLDEKASRVLQRDKVTPHDVRKVVSRATSIPIEEITSAERERLSDLESRLKRRVIGQDTAVERAVAAVKKARAGLADPNRPDAVMLFLGPTGVGKSQLAKALADLLFGSRNHLVTFEMSEYIEEHSVARLIGAPPGYVGHEEEGRLTAAVRNTPFSILLFDEIEKAHPRIFDLFLPVLDEGRLKDSRGREASFRNCIIIFTSNIGAELLRAGHDNAHEHLVDALRRRFRPEFINRIDEIVPFYPLLFEDIRAVLRLSFRELAGRLRDKDVKLRIYQGAYEFLAEQGYNVEFGARELRRTVERLVANPISVMVLEGELGPGDCVEVLMVEGEFTIRKGARHRHKEAQSA